MAPLDLDSRLQVRGLDAARRVLGAGAHERRESLWRPVLAAALAALAALGLCAAVFSQGPTQGDASSGAPGVRAPLLRR